MPDIVSQFERSKMMAAVRWHGNRSTEGRLRRKLQAARITGWRCHHRIKLGDVVRNAGATCRIRSVRPDFACPNQRLVVFVDGCFWHRCQRHFHKSKSNVAFWDVKTIANPQRDVRVSRSLRRLGWSVVRLWEHDVGNSIDQCIHSVRRALLKRAVAITCTYSGYARTPARRSLRNKGNADVAMV